MEQRHYYLVSPLAYTGAATAFTYHHNSVLAMGQIVQIPVSRRQVVGVVTGESPKPAFTTKPIEGVPDLPAIPSELQRLAAWMAEYYASSPSSVWSTLLPTGLTKKRRVARE
jgi:primosomal protein N' (replication factor Y) (superfamily II helicase)